MEQTLDGDTTIGVALPPLRFNRSDGVIRVQVKRKGYGFAGLLFNGTFDHLDPVNLIDSTFPLG